MAAASNRSIVLSTAALQLIYHLSEVQIQRMPQFSNSTMMRLLRGCILLCYIVTVNSKSITATPPPGNYIIHQEYIPNLSRDDIISISSNVAITIQRYSDGDQFTEDQTPIQDNEAMVIVTTNCHRESFKPTVTLGDTNDSGDVSSINVQIEDSDDIMYPFMFLRDNQSTSYHVEWPIKKDSPSCRSSRYGRTQSTTKRLQGSRSFFSSSIAHSSIMAAIQHIKGYLSSSSTAVKTDEQDVTDSSLLTLSNTCIVNVDILLNGCSHTEIDVSAPNNQFTNEKALRFFNGTTFKNTEQKKNEDDCIIDMSTNISFTSDGTTMCR